MAQLTTAQAAKALGIAKATLDEWRGRGQGPAYTKTGRLVRYPDYEVERWIRENTIQMSGGRRTEETPESPVPVKLKVPLDGHRFKGRPRKIFPTR